MHKETLEVIQTLGFPVVVSLWFMLRLEKKLERILELQDKLIDIIRDRHD